MVALEEQQRQESSEKRKMTFDVDPGINANHESFVMKTTRRKRHRDASKMAAWLMKQYSQ